jgi:hypothetical protein
MKSSSLQLHQPGINDKKALQVPLIGDVYRFANDLVIWLGEGNERVARSFSRMRHLHQRGLFGLVVTDGLFEPKIWGVKILDYIPNFVYRWIFNYFSMSPSFLLATQREYDLLICASSQGPCFRRYRGPVRK